nr:protein phosphatase 2C [Hemerocallis fulva]
MSCSVAMASSPVFSPSRLPLTCKTATSPSPSETLTLIPNSPSPSSSTSPVKSPFKSSRFKTSLFKSLSSPTKAAEANGLKRKRPAMRIDIPALVEDALRFEMEKMRSDGRREVEEGSDERWGVCCKRGRKRFEMEDRFRVDLDLRGDPQLAFFGIFDGHGGNKAAEFASENMGKNILDEVMCEGINNVEDAIMNGYLKTDSEFLKEGVGSGACCVTAFVKKGDLIVSNAGDCRAVLSVSGAAEALTSDHHPSREDERERIENLGGYVDFCRGLWRLQGCLAVSRGIGDSHLKEWVIPHPETRTLKIKPEFEFLILASDGLWDKVSNQEAVDLARPFCINSHNPSPLSACKKLADLSFNRGSNDDISVMIIQLRHFIWRE